MARKADLAKDRGNYVALLRAILEAITILKTNKARSIEIIKKYSRISDTQGLELAYEEGLNMVDDPSVDENVIEGAFRLLAASQNITELPPTASVINNSLLEDARKSLRIK